MEATSVTDETGTDEDRALALCHEVQTCIQDLIDWGLVTDTPHLIEGG
ncbi:hypothetical protein ACWZHB_01080 [Nocardia sp. FBN12]